MTFSDPFSGPKLDIASINSRASLKIDPEENDADRAARLARERAEWIYDIVRGYVVLFGIIVALTGISALCTYELIFDPSAAAETKRWAQTTISALFAGSVSFLLGQATRRK